MTKSVITATSSSSFILIFFSLISDNKDLFKMTFTEMKSERKRITCGINKRINLCNFPLIDKESV